jgi:hypothetical protein
MSAENGKAVMVWNGFSTLTVCLYFTPLLRGIVASCNERLPTAE